MNRRLVIYLLGRLLRIEALLMIPSLLVGVLYREGIATLSAFGASIVLTYLVGYAASVKMPEKQSFYTHEAYVLAASAWFLMSLFGALPFFLSGEVPSFIDAFFESASGFTTTGATVLEVTALEHSLLFWRSFTLLIGGMGMLIFILWIMPSFGGKGVYILKAELPGPVFGKVESRVSSTIHILYLIYLSMTGLLVLLLLFGGVPLFESFLLAFGAAGTGGFNISDLSIAAYNSPYVEWVMALAMFIFGMSFNFFYLVFIGKWRAVAKSEELKWYIGIVLGATLIFMIVLFPRYSNVETLARDSFFTVSSVISTTAYTTANYRLWPVLCHVVLLFLMFTGGMSGSTTSGLKVCRVGVMIKSIKQEARRAIQPDRVVPISFEGRRLEDRQQRDIIYYLSTYMGVFAVLLFLLSIQTGSFSESFSAVLATLNNIGHGLDLLGPSSDYLSLQPFTKIIMIISMVMGRLEIYPVLSLLSKKTWRKA